MKSAKMTQSFWIVCALVPALGILWVWLSSLSFVPVPWPDDSAFYFPAKDLFSWPPRWVMIPQSPFIPSYREWNFNTMPLLPILIGLVRLIGIDGSHALKLIPLSGWLFSCLYILHSLARGNASRFLLVATAFLFAFNPIIRWSSVLVRPESLIGFLGVFILFGYRFGFPAFLRERKAFHPVSLALALAAYLHFNAIHLVPMVIVLYWNEPKKIFRIGFLTALYLLPWLITIGLKPALFFEQMEIQFTRLSGYRNPWLTTWRDFVNALHPEMGSPESWSTLFRVVIESSVLLLPFLLGGMLALGRAFYSTVSGRTLVAGLVWFGSSLYLWHTKAEVWFTHFMHLSYFAWGVLVAHEVLARWGNFFALRIAVPAVFMVIGVIFFWEQAAQASRLGSTQTWRWDTYGDFIDCIEKQLDAEDARLGRVRPFKVWAPTFPDILIDLSRKHPDWEYTRTNDFYSRWYLGIRHGYDANAVVVPENYRTTEEFYSGPLAGRPQAHSVWMNWPQYFLIELQKNPEWKPRRYVCQRGRWDAFIHLPKIEATSSAEN